MTFQPPPHNKAPREEANHYVMAEKDLKIYSWAWVTLRDGWVPSMRLNTFPEHGASPWQQPCHMTHW